MQRIVELDNNLSLYKSSSFPKSFHQTSSRRYEAVIGIGGNVGDVLRRFQKLLIFFRRDRFITLLKTSPILKNPPFGYLEQNDFYNGVILIKTDLRPRALMKYLQRVEKKFGRKKSFQNAPRELDLDIVFFNNEKIEYHDLTIPHNSYSERQSVLIPLKYI